MQKVYINNLGPVKNFTMNINKFNILIGEQAAGKSTISKCVYFFRAFKSEIIEYLYLLSFDNKKNNNRKFPNSLNTNMKNLFVELFGYSWELDDKLEMKYNFTDDIYIDIYIEIKLNKKNLQKKYININCSTKLIREINNLEKEAKEINMHDLDTSMGFDFVNTERVRIHTLFKEKVNQIFDDDLTTYYIPAGRSLLTLMTSQKTKVDYDSIDYVNKKFMQFTESIQSKFENGILKTHLFYPKNEVKFNVTEVASSIVRNIKGDYRYIKGKEYLILDDNNKVKINYASSGQQEILWLFNQLYVLMLMKQKAFVIIEEPEAHLYPNLQKEVMEFITFFGNVNESRVFVTTHSPYILTITNVLYCAGKLKNKNSEKITGKYKYIQTNDLEAIKLKSLNKSTMFENLIDGDFNEIQTELIDEVSNEINTKYTKILYLEDESE